MLFDCMQRDMAKFICESPCQAEVVNNGDMGQLLPADETIQVNTMMPEEFDYREWGILVALAVNGRLLLLDNQVAAI